jgi:2-polyprenyl-6-methoxyphenol hydroxylase-like FAD-dependent oxidoreductase
MEKPKFKVVIVGGSVSGLTLANMLEKLNIDYVVLESYKTIAPQVGASIGLQANGLRILDQLGCAETLIDLVDTPLHSQFLRDSEGKEFVRFDGIAKILENRYARRHYAQSRTMLALWSVTGLQN